MKTQMPVLGPLSQALSSSLEDTYTTSLNQKWGVHGPGALGHFPALPELGAPATRCGEHPRIHVQATLGEPSRRQTPLSVAAQASANGSLGGSCLDLQGPLMVPQRTLPCNPK